MDPLTHVMAGALVAHACAGIAAEPAATLTAVGAAALPDLDFYARKYEGAKFLKVHHGATHSVIGILVQSVVAAVTVWSFFRFVPFIGFRSAPFFPLLFIAFLSVATHVLLDWIMHNNGLPLLWPFSERHYCVPLILGVNPRTVSHQCGERHYLTCFGCQCRGGAFNPVSWMIVVPAVLGFFVPAWRNPVGFVPWIAVAGYLCLCLFYRKRARRAACRIDEEMMTVKSYPGRSRPDRWLFVRRDGNRSFAILADGLKHCVMRRWEFRHEPLSPGVENAVTRVIRDLTPI
ncbi:metal-dependent hydrolase, partial [bacterium]|nr:metal-dependent hydrolase [candidate division CSSED10-310 bacterium]